MTVTSRLRTLRRWSGRTALAGMAVALAASAMAAPLPNADGAVSSAASSATWYRAPSPLPAGAPGSIIKSRRWTFHLDPAKLTSASAKVWQVMYRSTNALGKPIAVTGTILVPTSAWTGKGPRPVVAYATGTQGWGDQCAPSREMAAGTYDEGFAVENLLAHGWAVAVTDYPGLGMPGDELYAVGKAEGYAVLDVLRAAEHLKPAGLSTAARVGIEGYSQGGGAAAFAAQEQPSYARGLHLVGVALGGTPANLQAVANNINGGPFFAFLGGAAIGFNAAYPAVKLDGYLTAAGRTAFHQLDQMCQEQALATFAGKKIQDYTKGGINPMTRRAVEQVLDANDAGRAAPKVPVLQYHGLADEVIPYAVESALHTAWCRRGARSDLMPFPGDHVSTQAEAQPSVAQWLSSRFAGQAAPDNCSSPLTGLP